MEQLISFIMKNFGIVVIVIGIIYTLFFRKSPLESPPNRMPDFGGNGQRRPGQTGESRPSIPPAEAQSTAPQRQTSPPAPRQQQPVRVESRLPEPRMETRPASLVVPVRTDEAYAIEAQPMRISKTQAKSIAPSQSTRSGVEGLTREDLSRAVLWAEILGPPRARRPYRR